VQIDVGYVDQKSRVSLLETQVSKEHAQLARCACDAASIENTPISRGRGNPMRIQDPKADPACRRLRSATVDDTSWRCPGRTGQTTILVLLEVFLLGLVSAGIILAIPRWVCPAATTIDADGQRVNRQIMRLISTFDGQQIWGQLGTSEIVSIDAQTFQTRSVYRRNQTAVGNWSVSRDGRTFLISNDDYDFQIHRDQTLFVSEQIPNCHQLITALSADGSTAIRIVDGSSVRCWNLSGEVPEEFDFALVEPARRIGIDPSGQRLAVTAGPAGIRLYELKTGEISCTLAEYSPEMRDPVFSQDGNSLAGIRGLTLLVFDVNSGDMKWSLTIPGPEPFSCVAYSPDGRWLAASGITAGIQVFDLTNGNLRMQTQPDGTVQRPEFSTISENLYAGSNDGSFRIWSLSTGKPLREFRLYDKLRDSQP
jgi:hypothetical protein